MILNSTSFKTLKIRLFCFVKLRKCFIEKISKICKYNMIKDTIVEEKLDLIEDKLGANTTVDRGAMNNTILHKEVKLDNQIKPENNNWKISRDLKITPLYLKFFFCLFIKKWRYIFKTNLSDVTTTFCRCFLFVVKKIDILFPVILYNKVYLYYN